MTLSGNITFEMSANFFAGFSEHLVMEFPKKDDSWVQRLLKSKGEFESHFEFYSLENFKSDYLKYYTILEEQPIKGSERVLFFLKRKNGKT
jgi:hypothetical protein